MKKILALVILITFPSSAFAVGKSIGTTMAGGKTTVLRKALFTAGDSITHGVGGDGDGDSTNDWGYRKHLQDNIGVGVYDFIGSLTSPTTDATYDVNNYGTSGWAAAFLNTGMTTEAPLSLSNLSSSSIMLLHIGTNDVILQSIDDPGKHTNAQIIASINSVIDKFERYCPSCKVYVALIVPFRQVDMATWWDPFWTDLKAAMELRQSTDSNIVIVDMYNAFLSDRYGYCSGDWYNNCMNVFSGAHPSDNGYRTMADQWAACINNNSAVGCNGH